MKQTELSHKNTLDTGWQLLGELNLSVDSDTNTAIILWLTELFGPLDLSADFQNRVLTSVQDTVARVLHSDAVSITGHIHLSIFSPRERIPDRKPWGFFHIERLENQGEIGSTRNHALDFYLYVEGL